MRGAYVRTSAVGASAVGASPRVRRARRSLAGVIAATVLVVAVLCTVQPLAAQTSSAAAGVVGAMYETYRFGDAETVGVHSLSLVTIPFGARVPLFGSVELEASGAYARGRLETADGEASSIAGLTDTELRLRVPLVPGRANVLAIVSVPSGHETHDAAEAAVAGAIAADLLPFGITNWGSGGGAGLGLTFTRPVGPYGVGLSATYLVSREFEPLETDAFAYRPGNTLLLSIAADRTVGTAGKATLRFGVQHFSDDALDGANLFRSGRRYQATATYAFAAGARASGIVYSGVLHRERGASLDALTREVPAQNLVIAGGGLRLPFGRRIVQPRADLRLFRTEDGVGEGYVVGLGASAEWPVGGTVLVPTLRGRLGRVAVSEGAESGLTGVELGLAVRFGGGS